MNIISLFKKEKVGVKGKYNPKKYWEMRGEVYWRKIKSKEIRERIEIRQQKLLKIIESLYLKSPKIFEVGCGFGWNLDYLNENLKNSGIFGCDFSSGQLRYARNMFKDKDISFCYGEAQDVPFKDRMFDISLSVTVLQHIPEDKIKEAVEELERVTKDYIILIELDKNVTRENEIPFFNSTGVHFLHDYEKLFKKFKLIKQEDWADLNKRQETISLMVFKRK